MVTNTIIRTDKKLSNPSVGLNMLRIDIPNGLQYKIENGSIGILVLKKSVDVPIRFVTYNGRLGTLNNNFDYIENNFPPSVTFDEVGNTLREYNLTQSYSSGFTALYFKVEIGCTRVDILDTYNYYVATVEGRADYRLDMFSINIEQYAYNNLSLYCRYCNGYGDLRHLKMYKGGSLELAGLKITGDISNISYCMSKKYLSGISFAYDTNVFGEIIPVLESAKKGGMYKGKTLQAYLFNTQVTYKGVPINQGGGREFVFDDNGDYVLLEVDAHITETVTSFPADSNAINFNTKKWGDVGGTYCGHLINVEEHVGGKCRFTSGSFSDVVFTFIKSEPVTDSLVDYATGYGSIGYTNTSITGKNVAIPLDAKYLWVQVNGNDTSGSRKPSKVEFIDNI